jgi:hypothetical protein
MTITATFDDLEGDVPTAEGAGGQDSGSAKTDSKGKANKKTGRETRCMLSKTIVLTNEQYILDSKVSVHLLSDQIIEQSVPVFNIRGLFCNGLILCTEIFLRFCLSLLPYFASR